MVSTDRRKSKGEYNRFFLYATNHDEEDTSSLLRVIRVMRACANGVLLLF